MRRLGVPGCLESGDMDAVKDEMGDLLLQVMLNCQIASEEGLFTFEEVAKSEADKMIRRHPHVFDGVEFRTEAERAASWDAIKKSEKNDERKSVLDGSTSDAPLWPVLKKFRTRPHGRTEWDDFEGALGKVEEELGEVKEAVARGTI